MVTGIGIIGALAGSLPNFLRLARSSAPAQPEPPGTLAEEIHSLRSQIRALEGRLAAFGGEAQSSNAPEPSAPSDPGLSTVPPLREIAQVRRPPGRQGNEGTWTVIGTLSPPAQQQRAYPMALTYPVWSAPTATDCATFPRAPVLFLQPIGHIGTRSSTAFTPPPGTSAADCGSLSLWTLSWLYFGLGPP